MNEKIILDVNCVCKSYPVSGGELEILKGVSLQLHGGEWFTLLGASGSGKTTLLNLLGLLEKPSAGTIVGSGVDYSTLSGRMAANFRNRKIGFIFQSFCLLPELNVVENVMLPGLFGEGNALRERALALLARVGMSHRLTHHPAELSGGEQQRVSIARALINDPEIILADEPTGNLDSRSGELILRLLSELRAAAPDKGMVMITHNRDIADLSDSVKTLKDGILV